MFRSSRSDTAKRAFGMFGRGTIEKIKDDSKLQELDLNLLKDETKTNVERFGEYGFSSVPLGPSQKQGSKTKQYAAAVVAFLSGNRSHGVVLGVDDRRHRPQGLQEGEVTLYDDQAQRITIGRGGIAINGGDDNLKQGDDGGTGGSRQSRSKKLPITIMTGDASWKVEKDKISLKVGDNVAYTFTKEKIELKVGDNTFTIDSSGHHFKGGQIDHDDHKIDKSHKHTDAGGVGTSGPPE